MLRPSQRTHGPVTLILYLTLALCLTLTLPLPLLFFCHGQRCAGSLMGSIWTGRTIFVRVGVSLILTQTVNLYHKPLPLLLYLHLSFTLTLHFSLTSPLALVVDESMIPWKGNTGAAGLVPHLSYVKRKPEPLGVELKTVCDCSTGTKCL